MKIVCLVKFGPDVENFRYDYEKNVLVRENVHLVLNPEDGTALAHALAVKAEVPGTSVEVVTMAPKGVIPHLQDLVRRGVDGAVLISDPHYIGSDTYVTSRILSRVLSGTGFGGGEADAVVPDAGVAGAAAPVDPAASAGGTVSADGSGSADLEKPGDAGVVDDSGAPAKPAVSADRSTPARMEPPLPFDYIFTGTHTLDGGTAHVPAQIAEALDLPHLSNIVELDHGSLPHGRAMVDVDTEDAILTFEIDAPAVLGMSYSTKHKLPYIPYERIEEDVTEQITVVGNDELEFPGDAIGIAGSPTVVRSVEVKTFARKDPVVVGTDDEGIERVYQFLSNRGFLR